MPIFPNADLVVTWGYWLDEITGTGVKDGTTPATVTFTPVPLTGQLTEDTPTPNLRDPAAAGWVKTRVRVARVDPATGYFAAVLVASNDPDLDAYGGRAVTFTGEPAFVVQVPWDVPLVTATPAMVTALAGAVPGLTAGDEIKAIPLVELATTTPPPPPATYYTSTQTLGVVATAVDVHDTDPDAHPAIRTAAVGGVLSGSLPNPGFAVDMAEQSELTAGLATKLGRAANLADLTDPAAARVALALAAVAASGDAADLTGVLDAARIPTTIARDTEVAAAVTAAIAELRGAAPAALDTFLEVAARLADDADALAALTNQIATKADQTSLAAHTGNTSNPHAVTKTQVGLGAVANLAPGAMPVSVPQQEAIDLASTADRARPNHTGTQPATTIHDLAATVRGIVAAQLDEGDNITIDIDPDTATITISSTGTGGGGTGDGLDAEGVRDTIAAALAEGPNIDITVNDATDTITIAVVGLAPVATSGSAADLTTGTIPDARIPPGIARDSEVAAALAGKADTAHGHSGADITSGTVAYPRLPVGTAASTVAAGDDARLTNQRTPVDASVTDTKVAAGAAIAESKLALASDAAAGTACRRTLGAGAQQAAAGNHSHTGYAATSHTHHVGDLTATGARDTSTFLRGDNTFTTPPASTPTITIPYASAVTPDASQASSFAVTATGALTINTPNAGRLGQGVVVSVTASGANRAVTFAGIFVGGGAGTVSPFNVASGATAHFLLLREPSGSWRCLAQSAA